MNKPKKNSTKSNSTKKPPAPQSEAAKPMVMEANVRAAGSGPGDPGDPPSGN